MKFQPTARTFDLTKKIGGIFLPFLWVFHIVFNIGLFATAPIGFFAYIILTGTIMYGVLCLWRMLCDSINPFHEEEVVSLEEPKVRIASLFEDERERQQAIDNELAEFDRRLQNHKMEKELMR